MTGSDFYAVEHKKKREIIIIKKKDGNNIYETIFAIMQWAKAWTRAWQETGGNGDEGWMNTEHEKKRKETPWDERSISNIYKIGKTNEKKI